MYANELKTKLGNLATQMSAIVAKAKTEGDRGLTSDERTAFHTLEESYTSIEDSIKIAEKSDSIVDRLAKSPKTEITGIVLEEVQDTFRKKKNVDNSPRGKAFNNYMRQGERTSPEDRKTLSIQNAQTLTTTGGGYVVPTAFANQLEEASLWFGSLEGTVGKLTTSTGATLNYPTVNDTTHKGRILGVNTAVTETDLTFGQVNFGAFIASSDIVLVPKALIEDSYFDLASLLARLLGTRLGRLKNNMCTVGTGTTMPTGIVVGTVAAGNTVTFATGSTVTVTYSQLIDVEHSVDPSYRSQSTWMFNDTVLKILKKLVDGNNRPLWQPAIMSSFRDGAGVTAGTSQPLILEHPYKINADMVSPAASVDSILFGNLTKFMIREVEGSRELITLVERYAEYNQVAYLAWERYDSNIIDAGGHPIAVAIQSGT